MIRMSILTVISHNYSTTNTKFKFCAPCDLLTTRTILSLYALMRSSRVRNGLPNMSNAGDDWVVMAVTTLREMRQIPHTEIEKRRK